MTEILEKTGSALEPGRKDTMLDGYLPEEIKKIRTGARIGDKLIIWTQKASDPDQGRGKKTPAGVLRPCTVAGIYPHHAWVRLASGLHDSISWPEYQTYRNAARRRRTYGKISRNRTRWPVCCR